MNDCIFKIMKKNMMKTLSLLAIIASLCLQVVIAKENSFHRGKRNSRLKYAIFRDNLFQSLDVQTIDETYVLSGKHCLLRCVKNQRCFSANIAISPTQDGNVLCKLLSSDKYNSSDNFGQSQLFHHYSIASACESFPCKHGGWCQALYETDEYICNCTNGYTGKNCEFRMPCDVDKGWKLFESSCYKYFIDSPNWADAQSTCEGLNGSLVILNTVEEYEFLYAHVLPDKYKTWIGLRGDSDSVSSKWRWVDGSVPTYAKWGPDQPTQNGIGCVIALHGKHFKIQWNHEWNDRSCSRSYPFLCETKQNQSN